MIAVIVMTDGRDELLRQTMASWRESFPDVEHCLLIHDDSGSESHSTMLQSLYPESLVVSGPRSGFGGAICRIWEHVPDSAEYVFHLEDDFLFNRPIPIADMQMILENNDHVVQVALLRQPWNEQESAAGGIMQVHPESYTEQMSHGVYWVEHRRFFTTNPSLYRRSLIDRGWPNTANSEGLFGISLFRDNPLAVSAFYGRKFGPPMVTHIGQTRNGTGY